MCKRTLPLTYNTPHLHEVKLIYRRNSLLTLFLPDPGITSTPVTLFAQSEALAPSGETFFTNFVSSYYNTTWNEWHAAEKRHLLRI